MFPNDGFKVRKQKIILCNQIARSTKSGLK